MSGMWACCRRDVDSGHAPDCPVVYPPPPTAFDYLMSLAVMSGLCGFVWLVAQCGQ